MLISCHSSVLPHFSWTDNQCIASKCFLLQKNVRGSQLACLDSSLSLDEGMKGKKVSILDKFQSILKPVGLKV